MDRSSRFVPVVRTATELALRWGGGGLRWRGRQLDPVPHQPASFKRDVTRRLYKYVVVFVIKDQLRAHTRIHNFPSPVFL